MPHIHYLQSWPPDFRYLKEGSKTFEIRWNDRDYKVGDLLVLKEFDPMLDRYTGESLAMRLTYLVVGPHWDLPPNLCVLGFRPVAEWDTLKRSLEGGSG